MGSLEVRFEVWCSCGKGLCNQTRTEDKRSYWNLIVEPCEDCLEDAREEGRIEERNEKEKP